MDLLASSFFICFVAVLCRVSCFDLYCGFVRQRPYTRLKGGIWYACLFYVYYAFCHGHLSFQLVMHAEMSLIKIFLIAITFRLAPDCLLSHFLNCLLHCVQGTVSRALKQPECEDDSSSTSSTKLSGMYGILSVFPLYFCIMSAQAKMQLQSLHSAYWKTLS